VHVHNIKQYLVSTKKVECALFNVALKQQFVHIFSTSCKYNETEIQCGCKLAAIKAKFIFYTAVQLTS